LYDHSHGADIKDYNTGKRSRSLTSSGRMTLGFRPTDDLEANLIYQYMDADQTGGPAMRGCGTAYQQGCIGTYDRKSVDQGPDDSLGRRQITTLKIDWSLGDYDLASVTGYQDQHMDVIRDNDDPGNAVEIAGLQGVLTEIHNFTQEVRFSTADAEFWNWTVGAYYARLVSNTDVGTQLVISPIPAAGLTDYLILPLATSVAANTEDTGLFTNHSLQLTDDLEAQMGVRYQSHRQTNFLRTISNGLEPFIPAFNSVGADNAKVNEAITGSASLSYQLTTDMRIYASYGRSFRGGGYTTAPTTAEALLEYDPETSDSLELGFKSRLADGRIQVSGDVYYQKYHDFLGRTGETIRSLNSPQNGNDTLNFNANAVVKGGELQIDALLTDEWRAGIGASYTDAKYTNGQMPCNVRDSNGEIQNPVLPDLVNVCDAHGRLAGEPNWGFTANSEYTQPLGGVDGFVRGLYTFSSGRANDFIAGSVNDTASYGVFNLFAGVRNPNGDWEVSVWSKNLFDKKAVLALGGEAGFSDATGTTVMSGYQSVQTAPRREIGITGKYNFSL
jgi:iron complex outermembrane receptor protein